MKWYSNYKRIIVVTLYTVGFVIHTYAQAAQLESNANLQYSAVEILDRYIGLRLHDADWKDYSKYIVWPDEPSWDCKWVVIKCDLGTPRKEMDQIIVPVDYVRLGLFCYDFAFTQDVKVVTVNYELVNSPNGWKVKSPIPDYPEISAEELIKSIIAKSKNVNESKERRSQAETAVYKIKDAIKQSVKAK